MQKFQIQVDNSSKEKQIVQAQTEDGTFSEIECCSLLLNIDLPNGKMVSGKLISYHAIKTGLFLWKYEVMKSHSIEDQPFSGGIGLSGSRIVEFSCCARWGVYFDCDFLWIKDSSERYGIFEEAYEQSIIPTLIEKVEIIEKYDYREENKIIRLFDYMDKDFFGIPMTAPPRFVAQIIEVTRQNQAWEIKMTGAPPPRTKVDRMWPPPYDPNGSNNRQAIFILNDDYEVLDVKEESVSTQ